MPRNSQGLYTLPAGNPVTPGTLIEAQWANTTMPDIGSALTASLPRDGSAPMVGPLTLPAGNPTNPRFAANKAYVDQFIAYATGMPMATVFAFGGPPNSLNPASYILCNGQAVSRTTFADLFASIGTIYGSGDGATTFNVPNLQGQFVRGRDPLSRAVGSLELDGNKAHTHGITDPGHTHVATNSAHTHTIDPHSHTVNDSGHSHTAYFQGAGLSLVTGGLSNTINPGSTGSSITGISLDNTTAVAQPTTQATTIDTSLTGVSTVSEGTESRPKNVAMDFYIKAINDQAAPVANILGVTSSDDYVISVDTANPVYPNLVIRSNVPLGMVKLDATGKISPALLPTSSQTFMGAYDASTGNNPSQEFPAQTFYNGNTYLVIVEGTILLYDPLTYVASMVVAEVGSNLIYLDNGVNPIGWYYIIDANPVVVIASDVAINPIPGMAANDVQGALEELDTRTDTTNTSLAAHIADTTTHGTVGDIVGTTDTQTLTNKLIDGTQNRIINGSVDSILSGMGGSGNAVTGNADPAVIAYFTGQAFTFTAIASNSGPTTLNVNAIGARAITKQGALPLEGGEIVTGQIVLVIYDGTQFQVTSGAGGGGGVVPAGAMQMFFMNSAPSGWLEANGAVISRVTYATLFAAIGTVYGAGDGSTTFQLPDMRGHFARANGTNSNGVVSGTFGAKQEQATINHTHYTVPSGTSTLILLASGGSYNAPAGGSFGIEGSAVTGSSPTSTVNGSTETRPANIALLCCVKT